MKARVYQLQSPEMRRRRRLARAQQRREPPQNLTKKSVGSDPIPEKQSEIHNIQASKPKKHKQKRRFSRSDVRELIKGVWEGGEPVSGVVFRLDGSIEVRLGAGSASSDSDAALDEWLKGYDKG